MSEREKKKGFCLFFDWVDDLDNLEGADAWAVVKALCGYYREGTNPVEAVAGPLRVAVSIMFHQIKRGEKISEVRRVAALQRNNDNSVNFAEQKSAKVSKGQQCPATITITNTDTHSLAESVNAPAPACEDAHVKKQTFGSFGNVYLTEEQHADLIKRYGERAEDLIENFSLKLKSKGYQYADHHAAILLWAVTDSKAPKPVPPKQAQSFDVDDFFEAAIERGMGQEMEEQHGRT